LATPQDANRGTFKGEKVRVQVMKGWWLVAVGLGGLAVGGAVAAGIVLGFSGNSGAEPTKADYFARVARICGVYGPKLDRVAPPTDVTIPGEVVTPLRRVIPLLRAETSEVRALRPPTELAARIHQWLALKALVIATLEQTLHAAEAPDIPATAVAYLRFLNQAQAAAKAGTKIGFPTICSSSS
jgi:hypothetical protein